MSEIILHHYPESPVAEKVRVVLGLKGLAWRSVLIPRLPPKPDLVALTGGYRRTPVMQLGADVYCDSQCIIRELQRRHPEPTLYPGGGAGLVWGVSRWTDGPLFSDAIALVLGARADDLPEAFAADRGRLYFGPGFDLPAMQRALPHTLAQLRGQIGWIDERLAGGRDFMLGAEPGLPDALCYHMLWFIRGRYAGGDELLSQFPHLVRWMRRVEAIGHGEAKSLSATQALERARQSDAETPEREDPGDPQGLTPGMHVGVTPMGDGGDPTVEGAIVGVGPEDIAIRRTSECVGDVVVHFPRVGYRVEST